MGALKYGTKRAPGGYRKNAGRKSDKFKAECARLVSSPKWLAYCKDVLEGEKVVPQLSEGITYHREATPVERVALFDKLAAYGFGKPITTIPGLGEGHSWKLVIEGSDGGE